MESTRRRILVVDGDLAIHRIVNQALEGLGYRLDTAISGEEALKQLAYGKYELVLAELCLPGMDGIELLGHITVEHPEVKVVIISAYGTIADAVQVMKLGASDFLQKPFSASRLGNLIADTLDSRRVMARRDANYKSLLDITCHLIDNRDLDAALIEAHKAIGLDPERPEAFNLLGVLSELKGDHHEAMKHYRVALDLDPTYEPARQNMRADSGRQHASFRPQLG